MTENPVRARDEDTTVCGFCGREVKKLKQCPFCGGKYCDNCIHPRTHNCVRHGRGSKGMYD